MKKILTTLSVFLYILGKKLASVVEDLEMMEGPAIHPRGHAMSPSFGCLFVGHSLFEEEFSGCHLMFACDKGYGRRHDSRYKGCYERESWGKQPAVDFLLVRQPTSERLQRQWMEDWVDTKKAKLIVIIHHKSEVLHQDKLSDVSKHLLSSGYRCESKLLKAELCGAATWSSYCITVARLPSSSTTPSYLDLPKDFHLPISPRGCGNMVMTHYVKGITEDRFC